jgi:hypothetical protein
MAKTPLEPSSSILGLTEVDNQIAYVAQQRLDGYSGAVRHAIRRKAGFDRKVERARGGAVVFEVRQLVQIHRSDLYNTLSSERKLQPMWSQPKRVIERLTNSYQLEELDGTPITGKFSARRLRGFDARPGTKLWEEERRWKRLKETGESERRESKDGGHPKRCFEGRADRIRIRRGCDYDDELEERRSHLPPVGDGGTGLCCGLKGGRWSSAQGHRIGQRLDQIYHITYHIV